MPMNAKLTHEIETHGRRLMASEIVNSGNCRVWSWKPHREQPDYCGIYPRSSQAVRDACLSQGVLAWGDDTDVVIVMPKQRHESAESAESEQEEAESEQEEAK